ncbi:MAG: hypothetical protein ACI406_16560, partial [Victivallis vadensis]
MNIIDCCSQNTTYSAGKQTPCSIFFDFPLKISIGFCDRDASGGGYGFEFLLRKNYKTGFIIYQFICSIGGTPHRHVAGRVARAKRLAR